MCFWLSTLSLEFISNFNLMYFYVLTTNFWHKNVKCYELKQVMWQTDLEFIYVLNKIWTISQTCKNMDFINKNYFHKIFILTHVLFILDCWWYQAKQLGCTMNC
jgi:hypothetical protein